MKLYADPITVNCRKVIAGLDFLSAPYERVHVDFFKGEQKSPEYLAINANATLPALVDDDLILWESNAILQYAADKVSNSRAYSLDLKKRADINRWMLWESSSWFPSAYIYLVEHCVKPLFDQPPDAQVLAAQDVQFHKLAGILDKRLSTSKWLCGDEPTIADIAVAAPIHMHQFQKLPLAPHKHLTRWMTEGIEKLPCWERSYVGPGFTLKRA
ncbi:MAG: glutathione S-transferase family protein [Hyphomicrobium sp.]